MAELQQQFDLATRVKELLERAHGAVRQLHDVRSQVREAADRVSRADIEGDWAQRRREIVEALTAIEAELIQSRSQAGQDPINFPPMLDDQIAYLYSHVNEGYGEPTAGAHERYRDLQAELQPLLDRLQQVIDVQVTGLNQALRAAGATGVVLGASR